MADESDTLLPLGLDDTSGESDVIRLADSSVVGEPVPLAADGGVPPTGNGGGNISLGGGGDDGDDDGRGGSGSFFGNFFGDGEHSREGSSVFGSGVLAALKSEPTTEVGVGAAVLAMPYQETPQRALLMNGALLLSIASLMAALGVVILGMNGTLPF
ncbi:MAG: hypothetical protein KDD64_13350 [Bdellovibrionales bacterium]|nr:hypothetical protein [Bdellovibrionales bacterium]